MTYFSHRYYAKEIKRVFYSELEEEQERVFRTAFVGEIIQIRGENSEISEENSRKMEENKTQTLLTKKFFNFPSHNWEEREEYGKNLIVKKDQYKEKSILKVHAKRLNVLDE